MTQKFREEYSRTKVKKLSQLLASLREQTWKQKQHTHTDKKKHEKNTYELVWQFKTFLVAD